MKERNEVEEQVRLLMNDDTALRVGKQKQSVFVL